MDSELTNETAVKSLDQGVATTDSPTFAGVTVNGTVEFDGLSGTGAVSVTDILDQDDMSSNSATALATQQSIKAYVDSQVATADTLAEVLANGNTTGGTDVAVGTGDDITFADSSKAIFGAGNDLQIYHDGSNSYINDTGTGNLFVRASDNFYVQNSAGTETKAAFTTDGAVKLYYNGGTKFQTVSGGVDVTGVITTDGMTTSADINFGDNDKAVFGAGSDLQIYHDASNSYISDVGTGKLILKSNGTATVIQDSAGGAQAEFHANNKTVKLFNNNSLKLETTSTGIDVTGTVTADGLTVGTSGTNAEAYFNNGAKTYRLLNRSSDNAFSIFDDSLSAFRFSVASNGDISFFEDTGTTAKFFFDASAESLGIGNSTPSSFSGDGDNLVVGTTSGNNGISIISATDGSGNLYFGDTATTGGGSRRGQLVYDHASDAMSFATAVTERMRIDSSGNVGIGTSSPDGTLHVHSGSAGTITAAASANNLVVENNGPVGLSLLFDDAASNAYGNIYWGNETDGSADGRITYFGSTYVTAADRQSMEFRTAGTARMRIDSSGKVGIGTSSPSEQLDVQLNAIVNESGAGDKGLFVGPSGNAGSFVYKSSGDAEIAPRSGKSLLFATSTGGTEAMRIDSSGNLLVGTTDLTLYDETNGGETGFALRPDGRLYNSTQGNTSAIFNRIGTGGTELGSILQLRSNGTTVGSIGTNDGLFIGSTYGNDAGIRFASDIIAPSTTTGANRDAAIDLGYDSSRFKDLYLSGGAYLGGTGSANKLDDYEEGTWTPTQGSFTTWTSPTFDARYTKVGRMVFINLRQTGGTIGWSSQQQMGGLPFAPSQGASAYATDDGPVSDNGALLIWTASNVYFQKSNASETSLVFSAMYYTSA
jgi:hypothetical protein